MALILLPLLILLSSFPSDVSPQSTSSIYDQEKQTLLRIKSEWGNPPALDSWIDSASAGYCNWTGVHCSGGAVDGILLSNQNLNESIPASICDLNNLTQLDLSYNNLPGPFPTSLYNCSSLLSLDLSQNLFVGVLPSDIHRLSRNLVNLTLSANNFTGDVPPSIGRLPAVRNLYLDSNTFDGSFPAELGNISTLETLSLQYNPFRPASIPSSFGNLTSLTYLYMAEMNLVGKIPDTLAHLTKLATLDLSLNNLTGEIPSGIWMFDELSHLYLYSNHLSGEIPKSIGALGITDLDVSINNLSGSIPDIFGKMTKLQGLAMYYNRLSGEIPASIAFLPDLIDIRLFNNNLTGIIPPELGKHSKLVNLEVDDNQLSGELPEFLCAGQALVDVVAFDNNLTGAIPASLGKCPKLDDLQLYKNRLNGDFPAGIWSAVNLTTLLIHHNEISGELPNDLPWNLTRMEIESNRFTGRIPSSAGKLKVLKADNNLFSGNITASIAGMPMLQVLSLAGNMISGSIPDQISKLRWIYQINLKSNQISGEIPAGIGSLPVLTSLDLSDNSLSGEIPASFGNLKLSFLNLSSNHLSGEVPATLQNEAYNESFLSNPGLCSSNSHIASLHVCGSESNGSGGFFSTRARILFVALGVFLFSVTVAIGFFAVRAYRRRRMDGGDGTGWKLTSFHALDFTESNIVRGLTDENQIGSGGSGKVYRVALGRRAGEIVAVKRIWNSQKLDSKLEKEFLAEVQILGSIRHRNIVKLLCCISNPDSKLLVYEYMENGSLDQWLHRRAHRPVHCGPLDWPTRLGIAIGTAQGLCYMHHDCSPPIVHRDVKSSNILLDSELGAKVADFGLARILVKAGEAESVSAIAGSFGYMAPECGYLRKVNEKVDVYSFGVVLLELVTGRKANDSGEVCLAEWTWRYLQDGGSIAGIVDDEIGVDTCYMDDIEVVLQLGLICTNSQSSVRPSMKEALQILLRCDPMSGINESGVKLDIVTDAAPLLQAKKGSKRVNHSDDIDYDRNGSNGSAGNDGDDSFV